MNTVQDNKTVIVVDDEPIVRMDLTDMLTEQGYEVVGEAEDGFDAVEMCRTKHPDVVIMDVRMSVFDGLSAAQTIYVEQLAGCVILLTAYSDRSIVDRAAEAGVSAYLLKPVKQEALIPAIEIAAAQSRRLRDSEARAEAAESRIRENRLVYKAQKILARQQGCDETEAYRRIRKLAMDKRISVARVAELITGQAENESRVDTVKRFLMENRQMSENRAFRYITEYEQRHGCTTEEAAEQIYLSLMRNKSQGNE